jgi:hypothetical protein
MKNFVIGVTILVAVSTVSVSAQNGPVIPAWVKPGLVVTYDSVSAFVNQYGRFNQGIRVVMTTRVNSVSGGKVLGVTQVQTVGTPISGRHEWACNAAGNCATDATGLSGKFWIDPDHAVDSIKGPNGETFKVVGQGPYSYGGRSWSATMLSYQNPDTGVQINTTFDTKSGLILAHSENSPSQQVHAYFRSMSGQ